MKFRYVVTVEADSKEQADQVISERVYHDEWYGFDYTISAKEADDGR